MSAAGFFSHPPLIDIDTASAAKRIEALPWIKSARVSVHWPDSVSVGVTERTAVAVVRGPERGTSPILWALVDSTGRVLADQTLRPAGLVTMDVFVAPGLPGSELSVSDLPGVDVAGSAPYLRPSVVCRRGRRQWCDPRDDGQSVGDYRRPCRPSGQVRGARERSRRGTIAEWGRDQRDGPRGAHGRARQRPWTITVSDHCARAGRQSRVRAGRCSLTVPEHSPRVSRPSTLHGSRSGRG